MAYPTLVLAFVKFIAEIILLIVTVLVAVKVVGWFTKGEVDEWKEIRKGNVAVAIYMAGVIISVSFIVQPGIKLFLDALSLDVFQAVSVVVALEAAILRLVTAFVVAMVVQFIALEIVGRIHRLFGSINAWAELEKGNVGVGILMGAILAVIGILLSGEMSSILDLIRSNVPEILRASILLLGILH